MISDNSIQEIRDIDLVEVAKKYVADLKKKGANYGGCCPFHDEKSPSFMISPAKGFYKCFGCGAGGADAIKFVMAAERLDFLPAVKYLADWFNITLEETRVKDEEPEEQKAKKVDYLSINKWAAGQFQKQLLNLHCGSWPVEPFSTVIQELLGNRKLTNDSIIDFQLGYAPVKGRLITDHLVERGLMVPGEELGLVKKGSNNNYDIYRDRIMFPIHNERGEVVGFGGRKLEDNKKDNPKYINSRDSLVYKKDQLLYGLYQAGKAIRDMKFAILVEGYYDVISFHQGGMANTVGACGTAFTDGHARLLKKYTNHIILMGDPDAAGQKANLKNVDLLLRHSFKIEICELPEKQDPDSFTRTLEVVKEVEDQAA
jgi:DNA primase